MCFWATATSTLNPRPTSSPRRQKCRGISAIERSRPRTIDPSDDLCTAMACRHPHNCPPRSGDVFAAHDVVTDLICVLLPVVLDSEHHVFPSHVEEVLGTAIGAGHRDLSLRSWKAFRDKQLSKPGFLRGLGARIVEIQSLLQLAQTSRVRVAPRHLMHCVDVESGGGTESVEPGNRVNERPASPEVERSTVRRRHRQSAEQLALVVEEQVITGDDGPGRPGIGVDEFYRCVIRHPLRPVKGGRGVPGNGGLAPGPQPRGLRSLVERRVNSLVHVYVRQYRPVVAAQLVAGERARLDNLAADEWVRWGGHDANVCRPADRNCLDDADPAMVCGSTANCG